MTSDSFMMRSSSPSILTSVPDHLPNKTRSPCLQVDGDELAGFVAGAGADGDDFALLRLLLGGVGNDDAALRLVIAFNATDDDAVVQRSEFHGGFLSGVMKRSLSSVLALTAQSANHSFGIYARENKKYSL